MVAPSAVKELLRELQGDRKVWAVAPCGHEYRLADSELFYGSEFSTRAREFVELVKADVARLRDDAGQLKHKLTDGFTKKSVEVKLGKTVEKVLPVLPGFPYNPLDCRALFDPIDYVAFVGAAEGSVRSLEFVDVKTGHAQLKDVQRQIRDAVTDGAVKFRRMVP